MNKMKLIFGCMMILYSLCSYGFEISPLKAYEVIGENVNVRLRPIDGEIVEKLSAPTVFVGGNELKLFYDGELEDSGCSGIDLKEWIAIEGDYPSDGRNYWISAHFVRELPNRSFNSSFCGKYDGWHTQLGTVFVNITEKSKGWYLVEVITRHPGVGFLPDYYAARPIHERSACDFDGLELIFSLHSPDELDNPLSEKALKSSGPQVAPYNYLIVTGSGALRSTELQINKSDN